MTYHADLTLDTPPAGWNVIDVMPTGSCRRAQEWVALMIDVPFDDLKHCLCRTAWLYVHPNEYRPDGNKIAQQAYVRVPGKHRTHKAAWRAWEELVAACGTALAQ